jgi:hypothetical protein
VGSSTSGAVEAVVRSAWCVAADLIPFDGGALRSFVVEIPPFPNSRFFGSVMFVKPYPAMAWRLGRNLFNKEKDVIWSFAMEMLGCGVGSQELETGDFPSAEGMYLIQAIKRYSGSGAPPAASCLSSISGFRGRLCNFAVVLGLSVSSKL